MRTGNELERLTVAEPALLGRTEHLVDASEREQILERILATDRSPAARRGRISRSRRTAFVLVGVALAAAAVAGVSVGHGSRPASVSRGPERFRLSGASIQLAGYRFRTPAGFKRSAAACGAAPSDSGSSFSAAAAADGGCVEAAYLIAPSNVSADLPAANPVDVGSYQGHYVPPDAAGQSTLYVGLPKAGSSRNIVYLVLIARGLAEDELVAVAVSGLPG
jgi:hypothetical protein